MISSSTKLPLDTFFVISSLFPTDYKCSFLFLLFFIALNFRLNYCGLRIFIFKAGKVCNMFHFLCNLLCLNIFNLSCCIFFILNLSYRCLCSFIVNLMPISRLMMLSHRNSSCYNPYFCFILIFMRILITISI
jgi:hypothetical protein